MAPIPRLRDYTGPALLTCGFRPFFLFGFIVVGLGLLPAGGDPCLDGRRHGHHDPRGDVPGEPRSHGRVLVTTMGADAQAMAIEVGTGRN
jgi:hypothetical protein